MRSFLAILAGLALSGPPAPAARAADLDEFNLDDGKPLVPDPAIKEPRSIGRDEVTLMHACYVGVQSDKRLFVADAGNRRIASVKLGYALEERIPLKDVPDSARK